MVLLQSEEYLQRQAVYVPHQKFHQAILSASLRDENLDEVEKAMPGRGTH